MRLTFITVRRVPDLPSPLLEEVTVLLRRAGHDVEHRRAEDTVFDATVRGTGGDRAVPADLYLLKSHSELALSLAGALHDRGARLLNPFPSCALTQDKVRATQLLHTAGVPVPQTRVVSGLRAAAALFEGAPLVVKPVRGHRGSGVRLVRDLGDVEGWDESVDTEGGLLVQTLVDGPGEDLKVYVVGSRVWAVRKPFSPNSFSVPGRPVAVDPTVATVARQVGRVIGLSVFGVDVIESRSGPVVVDVNYFPGFKGCAGVAGPLAHHIHAVATGRRAEPGPVSDVSVATGLATAR